MSHTPDNPSPARDNSLAVCLLAGAVVIYLGWQCLLVWKGRSALATQATQREQLVKQSKAVQADLERLANGLVELAKTDPAAKALVDRYGITVTPPAGK
jgi:Tfp pilus assembly protein PilO